MDWSAPRSLHNRVEASRLGQRRRQEYRLPLYYYDQYYVLDSQGRRRYTKIYYTPAQRQAMNQWVHDHWRRDSKLVIPKVFYRNSDNQLLLYDVRARTPYIQRPWHVHGYPKVFMPVELSHPTHRARLGAYERRVVTRSFPLDQPNVPRDYYHPRENRIRNRYQPYNDRDNWEEPDDAFFDPAADDEVNDSSN